MGRRIKYGPAQTADLAVVLDHLKWGQTRSKGIIDLPDLGLDKKALKQLLARKALIECGTFFLNLRPGDAWLTETFKPRLGPDWRSAMGPKNNDDEMLYYLAGRVGADALRAGGRPL